MPTYLDNNATTHLDARVLEAMLPYLSGPSANASSLHRYGRIARDAVEHARAQVAPMSKISVAISTKRPRSIWSRSCLGPKRPIA